MSFTDTEFSTEWIKFPKETKIVFVGKDTVALSKGCHIYFYSLLYGTNKIYSATRPQLGDGVECYCGHLTIPVLAFAEKCLNPRIFIINYPDLEQIKIIPDGAPEGYQTLALSDFEYMITLSNLPEFELGVWNWRTGEKLAVQYTNVHAENQILICSFHYPLNVVQHYENATTILLWEIHNCYKKAILRKKKLVLPYNDKSVDVIWNPEGNLFVLNKIGCVYMLVDDLKLEIIIYGAVVGDGTSCFTWYKGGFAIMEPNYQVKHFKKYVDWVEDWSVDPVKLQQIIANNIKDYLIGWSDEGEILELDLAKECFITRKNCGSHVSDFCLIYPLCNYFVGLSIDGELLKIWDALLGTEVSTMPMEDKVNVITSNPVYPYIAAGLFNGTLLLISIYNPETPTIITKLRLYLEEITKVIFNEEGNLIATAHMKKGLFFVIRGTLSETMEILSYIDYRRTAIDIAILEDEKSYKLLILVQSEEVDVAGQRIVAKMISKTSLKVKKKKYLSPKFLLTNFTLLNKTFYGKIFNETFLSSFQLQKKNIKFVSELLCNNHPRHYLFKTNGQHLYTYGFNGILTVRNEDFSEELAAFLIHHRKNDGIVNALVDPHFRYVISLGKENEMVCTKIVNTVMDDKVFKNILRIFHSYRDIFYKTTIGYDLEDEITWLEVKEQELLIQEQKQNAKERKQIMEEFLVLKKEVVQLLNQNLHGPELEKIDILEFYLHTKLKEHKEKMCEKECEWTILYNKELIRAQTELWECMIKKFWDTQLIKRSVIKGIFCNFFVENYGMVPEQPRFQFMYNYTLMFREFEEMLRAGDIFLPWVPKTQSCVEMTLDKTPIIKIKSEETRIMEALEEDIDEDETLLETSENFPSSTASDFIDTIYFYAQEEIHTYTQNYLQRTLMTQTNILISKIFNHKYDEMMDQKRREMNTIIEKNNRLRFILSELKNYQIFIKDPKWHPTENPETIIIVEDWEVPIRPYISPSRQAILDWEAAEAERIRLLLLADDFRERALIKMMDGVLEVRWEDTLKRDIPKPKCMLEKKPETFNEEDLRAIRDYEEKVAFLNSERQRYKNMLENEYGKLSESVREAIKKFNSKLRELMLFKIKTETAKSQHILMMQGMQDVCLKRENMHKKEKLIRKQMETNQEKMKWYQNKVDELNEASNEIKMTYDILFTKDKNIEKNFKRDIQDFSALVQEQAYKLYKKQPKVSPKNLTIPTLLVELGSCIVSQESSPFLTGEYREFEKAVEKLDDFVGLPNTIDELIYRIICKYRRLKIESELRLKANSIEQADIDSEIQIFQKLLTTNKEYNIKCANDINILRKEKLDLIHDKQLQIVIKKGLVEIPCTGIVEDFDSAIMVARRDIEHINAIILKAGDRKLKVMREKMFHRRQILEKEWEHKKKLMEIEDLKEYLYMVEKVKVTKEIQRYLRQKAKGETFDKGLLTMDQEIECKRKAYEKMIAERRRAIGELDKQIKDYKRKNNALDEKISEVNIDVCEQETMRDLEFERSNREMLAKRMAAIKKRSKLVKKIQEQHNEILVLQTELELARLKTYPTLKFKTLT